jgi:hypothetical protein
MKIKISHNFQQVTGLVDHPPHPPTPLLCIINITINKIQSTPYCFIFIFQLQSPQTTTTILEASQMEEATGKQEKRLSTSPLSSEEGLVLAGEEEFDMDLDTDRYKKNFEKSIYLYILQIKYACK